MNNKPQTYEQWLYDEKARLALVNAAREAVAELRHTKAPNKRLATLIQKKLDDLPKELDESQKQISVSRWARLTYLGSGLFSQMNLSVDEKRCYQDGEFTCRYEDTHVFLCWSQTENTWERVDEEIDRSDPSDTLERIEQEQENILSHNLAALDVVIEQKQAEIDKLRAEANALIAALPIPKAATLRTDPFFWTNPTQWARSEFPHIWPEK